VCVRARVCSSYVGYQIGYKTIVVSLYTRVAHIPEIRSRNFILTPCASPSAIALRAASGQRNGREALSCSSLTGRKPERRAG
jgi:hypothetical protein